jgi:hypothetical protein
MYQRNNGISLVKKADGSLLRFAHKTPEIAGQAILYLANCQSGPFIAGFLRHKAAQKPASTTGS